MEEFFIYSKESRVFPLNKKFYLASIDLATSG